jgi:hypothetical protein
VPITNVRVLTANEQYHIAVNRQEAVRRRAAKRSRDALAYSNYQRSNRARIVRPKLKRVVRHNAFADGVNYGG